MLSLAQLSPSLLTDFANSVHKQVEAEVVSTSSLVEVKVEVEVGDEVGVKVRAQNYFFGLGGWVAEEMENKAIFQLEVEVGYKPKKLGL